MKKVQPANQNGFAHLVLIMFVLVIAVVGGVGFVMYRHNNKAAHADNMTRLGVSNQVTIYACKTYIAQYGGVYQVKAKFLKTTKSPSFMVALATIRPNKDIPIQQATTATFAGGTSANLITNLSLVGGDQFAVVTNGMWGAGGPDTGGFGPMSPSKISNC